MYNNQIINQTNKTKTTQNVIKSETGRNDQNRHDGGKSDNLQVNPDSFNNCFLSVAKKITQKSYII